MLRVASLAALLACASAAPSWHVVSDNLATIIDGVGALSDTTVFVPAGENGVGTEILKTTDSGKTWSTCPREGGFLLLNMGSVGDDVVASGVLGCEFSDNSGGQFNASKNCMSGQCVRVDGDSGRFWVVGQGLFDGDNGVSISDDGGKTFTHSNVSSFETFARYGAFPTKGTSTLTWYVSAGEWPSENGQPMQARGWGNPNVNGEGSYRLSERVNLVTGEDGKQRAEFLQRDPSVKLDAGLYNAQIAKTTDGGKTWSVVLDKMHGDFYFNGIDASPTNENIACAVGEADGGADPGSRIYCTDDGGKTWTRTAYFSGPQYSLLDIRFLSDNEVWATGGDMSGGFEGWYLHSMDAGKTWEKADTVTGIYGNSLDFPDLKVGWSSAFTRLGQSSVVTYQ